MHLKHIAIILLVLMSMGTAHAVTTIPAGKVSVYTLNAPFGQYELGGDIWANASALYVPADNVVLDLNGYDIKHANVSTGYGIYITGENVTIKNGTITQSKNGITGQQGIYFNNLASGTIDNISISETSGACIYFSNASNVYLTSVTAINLGGKAVSFVSNSNYNTFYRCSLSGTVLYNSAVSVTSGVGNCFNYTNVNSTGGVYGFYLNSNAHRTKIYNSNVISSSFSGIYVGRSVDGTIVSNTTTHSSTQYGAYLNSANNTTIALSYLSSDSGDGIYCNNSRYTRISDSTATSISGTGIRINNDCSHSIFSLSCLSDTGRGVWVQYPTTDSIFNFTSRSLLANTDVSPTNISILVVGDSKVAGGRYLATSGTWSLNFSDLLSDRFYISNQGLGGEKASGGKSRIGNLLNIFSPDVTLISYGYNDIANGIAQQTIIDDILYIASLSRSNNSKVYVLTCEPCDNSVTNSKIIKLNENITTQSLAAGYRVINTYDAIDLIPNNGQYDGYNVTNYRDGVHPNDVGNQLIGKTVYTSFYNNEIKRKNGLYLGYTSAWNGTWWNIVGPGPAVNWDYIGDEIEVTVS